MEGMGCVCVCEAHLLTTLSAASSGCNLTAGFHLAKRKKLKENQCNQGFNFSPACENGHMWGNKATLLERENDRVAFPFSLPTCQ